MRVSYAYFIFWILRRHYNVGYYILSYVYDRALFVAMFFNLATLRENGHPCSYRHETFRIDG